MRDDNYKKIKNNTEIENVSCTYLPLKINTESNFMKRKNKKK